MKAYTYLIIASLCFFIACNKEFSERELQENSVKEQLLQAESLLPLNPNDALNLLNNMPNVDEWDVALKARWCMIYGKAINIAEQNDFHVIRFAQAYCYYSEYGTLQERSYINYFYAKALAKEKEIVRAIEVHLEALSCIVNNENNKLSGDICYSLGEIYRQQELYPEAIEKISMAINYYKKAKCVKSEVKSISVLAFTYLFNEDIDNATNILNEGKRIAIKNNDKESIAIISRTYANLYNKLENFELAEKNALEAIKLDNRISAPNYLIMASIYLNKGEYDLAKEWLKKADTAKYLNIFTPKTIAYYRYKIAEKENKQDKALIYYKNYIKLGDSLDAAKNSYHITEAEKSYKQELGKRVMLQVDNKKKQNAIFLVSTSAGLLFVILLTVISVPFVRTYIKEKSKMLEVASNSIIREHRLKMYFVEEKFESELNRRAMSRMEIFEGLSSNEQDEWAMRESEELHKMQMDYFKGKTDSDYFPFLFPTKEALIKFCKENNVDYPEHLMQKVKFYY